jgi:hypothetical protein
MNHHGIPDIDTRGLRRFGLTFGAVVSGLFGLALPWLLDRVMPIWPWIVLITFTLWALFAPASLRPFYKSWMRFGLLMSRITTPMIMGLVFFFVVTPVALLRRIFSSDPLKINWDQRAESYRAPSTHRGREHLERPF